MKMFRRIFALTMVVAMVCLLSSSAFAARNFRYSEDYSDPNNSGAVVFGEIDQYMTSGTLELITPDGVGNYIYIELDHVYIDRETGAVVSNSPTAVRVFNNEWSGSVVKAYNDTLIVEMVSATYTFYASFNNYMSQPLEFNFGPKTITYREA